jgi:hypothetical protein
VSQCRDIENCEKVEKSEAYNLPWRTEFYDTEGKVVQDLGEGEWRITCRVLGQEEENECSFGSAPESLVLINKATKNGTATELLVLATFQHLRKLKCSIGETEITGNLSVLKTNGWGLRVS